MPYGNHSSGGAGVASALSSITKPPQSVLVFIAAAVTAGAVGAVLGKLIGAT